MVDLIGDTAANYALLSQSARRISWLIPDVSIEETHRDDMEITQHPVEVGATITDHAFKRPAEVQMRLGWSDSKHQSPGYVQRVYQSLLQIQANREPFTLSTGKRTYNDMLIASIAVTTDVKAEFALSAVVTLHQIIITDTSGTIDTQGDGGGGGSFGGIAPSQQNLSAPQENQFVVQMGTQQLSPIGSAQSALFGSFLPGGGQLGGFPTAVLPFGLPFQQTGPNSVFFNQSGG